MPTTTAPKHSFRALRDELQASLLASSPNTSSGSAGAATEIAAHQQDQLRALLAHAVEHSPFHARRLRGIDLGRGRSAATSRSCR